MSTARFHPLLPRDTSALHESIALESQPSSWFAHATGQALD